MHGRPAAFEGADGFSYSVEILTDTTGTTPAPWGAYLFFVKWSRVGAQAPEGHLESEFLATADTEEEARRRLGAVPLQDVKRVLDELIAAHRDVAPTRRWSDAMPDDT